MHGGHDHHALGQTGISNLRRGRWDGKTLHELYSQASTPWEWQPELKRIADDLAIDLLLSPFDPTAVDLLESTGVPAYKVASFEVVDLQLIQHMARTGKPLIISTGSIRPGHGLHPRHLPDVLGRRAARAIERGTPLSWDLVGDE